jgi:hypothetical protein
MADIHVIFPKDQKAIVRNDGEVMTSGEMVTWSFHSDDPDLQIVEVEFSDKTAHNFFPERPEAYRFSKAMANGRADFYGHVPAYPGRSSTVIAKYTVRGLRADGSTPVDPDRTVVDPVIITPKP